MHSHSSSATLGFASDFPGARRRSRTPTERRFGHNATESFSNPNGIAVDEATGDVYVADIGTNTVYKFDASGNPVNFAALGLQRAHGAHPVRSFSFPSLYGTPAAIAVDNSSSPSDPSAGDLYVMDAGNGVIDKFNPEGRYLSQMGGFAKANCWGWASTGAAPCTST